MSESPLQFHFRGSESRDAANELAQFLGKELPDWPSQVVEQTPSGEAQRADPLTIIALILSVPPAIESSWDLTQRIKLKEKMDRLIAWAKARAARHAINPSVMLPRSGQAVPLDQATPQQVLDAIAAQATAEEKGQKR
jgi:hypothetical protein